MHPVPRHMSAASQRARTILRPIAERGLLHRPLNLILGPSAVPDCLSPYCRDLGQTLRAWASLHELTVEAPSPDDQIYAVAEAFCQSGKGLLAERRTQERVLGISEHCIDAARLDPRAFDSRIDEPMLYPFDSVFILASELNPGTDAEVALALVELIASRLQSIAISWPKGQQSEQFVDGLRAKHATPLHLLDYHPARQHSSACRYLNNISRPSPEPEAVEPKKKETSRPLPKDLGPGRYLRIKA